jgi:hypothetical protein
LYDLESPPPEDLLDLDDEDKNLASSSFSTHQSPSTIHRRMEEIMNTSDHMIVDPPPVTFQEKGKFRRTITK